MTLQPPTSTLFPYTTLFRSRRIMSSEVREPLNLGSDELVTINELVDIVEDIAKVRSEEHTSELQSRPHLVCRLLLEKKKTLESITSPLQNRQRRKAPS